MNRQLAFLDEFGNFGYDFEKDNVSSHYIVTAILINEPEIKEIEKELEKVRKNNFQTGEMKSSKVGSNHKRRMKILSELNPINFHIYSFAVDKRKLNSPGLQVKTTFYKFLNGLVESKLFQTFPQLKLSADEIGSKEFMSSFVKYIEKKHIPDLFNYSEFGFRNSKSSLLIQLADFMTGTIARAFDKTVLTEEGKKFLKIIRTHIIEIVEWPRNIEPYIYIYDEENTNIEIDSIISQQSINLSRSFISKNKKSKDKEIVDQVNTLRFLLFYFRYISYKNYVSTFELKKSLNISGGKKKSSQYFRSRIIAKLRDSGVLIASSNKGYKLPANKNDLYDFINHSSQIIKPLLSRMVKCRNHIKLATKNDLDIFQQDEYDYLRKMVT